MKTIAASSSTSHFRADKFYPPQVESPQFLFRERIVTELSRRCTPCHPNVLLEAQAGQGKTTLIKQFLNQLGLASAWYQVGHEDADPSFFLQAIRSCVSGLAPRIRPASGTGGLTGGDMAIFDLPERVDLLLDDVQRGLDEDAYLVFDDLHNLIGHESSLSILNRLVENAPARLHFVLSSREPLALDAWKADPGERGPIRIGNGELALSENEIADFYHLVYGLALPRQAILEIASTTDGWIMGVLLIGLQMARTRGDHGPVGRLDMGRMDIKEYFRRKIFAALDPTLHASLLMLSLLEDIPVGLAIDLTQSPGIGEDLANLARRNIFIRPLDPDCSIYGLHHLFRQFLREKAEKELSPHTVEHVYRQAGLFFSGKGNPAQAMRYLLQAGDHPAIEDVLRSHGMALLAANQTATLASILGRVPRAALDRLGWVPFYLALAQLDFAPARALPLLDQALEHFSSRHDGYGELLCLAHIIAIHITTTGHYREGVDLLAKAERLFTSLADSLAPSTTVLLAGNLAMGYAIFLSDIPTATRYATLGLNQARKEGLVNFEALLLMVMGYLHIFAGRLSGALPWLEQAAAIIRRPEVGTFHRLAIRMMLFNHLYHDGDFANYFLQKNQLVAAVGREVMSQSIAGPFCPVWEMDIALNQGLYEDALDLADQTLDMPPALSPHMRSLVLQLKAIALAQLGKSGQALAAAEQSTRLREMAGGPYFTTLNKLLSGTTLGLCHRHREGLALLTEALECARAMPSEYLEAGALMHRGALWLDHGETEPARRDIEAGLRLMRRNAYRHFWAWTPTAIEAVLGFAAANRIEADTARDLAARHLDAALDEDGRAIPRIELRMLGGCTLYLRGAPLLKAEDLTPAQRELLCLLAAAPGMKMVQENTQLHFWPDSPASAAKASFDTMVSRLRKALADALPGKAAHLYLKRDKGIVWLANCRVDALEFLDAARRSQEHFQARSFWQANNGFTRAEALWRGDFAPGITGEDTIRDFRYTLKGALARMALTWCPHLAEIGHAQHALDLAEKALRVDSFNDSLWALLHGLHARQSALAGRNVLDRFARLLRSDGYPDAEIAGMVRGVASASNRLFPDGGAHRA